jgi:elongation factor P--beta-lysine ligase
MILHQRFATYAGGSEVASAYVNLMEACDMARYAPVEDRPRQQLFNEAAALIGRTEQLVRA